MPVRRLWISLIGIVVVSLALLVNELRLRHEPALGLDLQGGVSVILEPTTDVDDEQLEFVADIVRDAVDSLGIAEPDVRVEGETIAVDLPGVKDQSEALRLTQVTGKVSLHPVLTCSPTPFAADTPTPTSSTALGGPTTAPRRTTTTTTPATSTPASGAPTTVTTAAAASTTAAAPGTTGAPAGGLRRAATPTSTSPTTAPPSTVADTTPTTPGTTTPGSTPGSTTPGSTVPGSGTGKDYPIEQADGTVLVGNGEGECFVGPAGATGEVISRNSASAVIDQGGWAVQAGIADAASWNAIAAQCFQVAQGVCPAAGVDEQGNQRGALAIVLDGEVQSAPLVNAPSFSDQVTITGDFSEDEARQLASVLNRGAYPFEVEPATVQTVSPSLGSDSLRATLLAGAIGIFLVMVFMFFYYRSLGLVILAGLALSGVIMYGVIAFLSNQRNLALTLSGAAGIIVSIGVTVDSYVVFFERLKDEVRHGRTLRNSAQRGFDGAWRTIVNANVTALIGALVLFWLSVGSVRGFAFFLAMSTVVDIIVSWFFTRPAVLLLARSNRYGTKVLGVDSAKSGDALAGEPA